jgi:amino acid permease
LLVILLSIFLTANAEVTRLPLDAVMGDIAVAIARIANAVIITFSIQRANEMLFIKNRLLDKVSHSYMFFQ